MTDEALATIIAAGIAFGAGGFAQWLRNRGSASERHDDAEERHSAARAAAEATSTAVEVTEAFRAWKDVYDRVLAELTATRAELRSALERCEVTERKVDECQDREARLLRRVADLEAHVGKQAP